PAVVAAPGAVVLGRLQLVRLPVVVLVPVLAVEHVDLAVLVDVRDGDALGPELRVQDGLLPGDRLGGRRDLRGGGHGGEGGRRGDGEGGEQPAHGGGLLRVSGRGRRVGVIIGPGAAIRNGRPGPTDPRRIEPPFGRCYFGEVRTSRP